MTAIPPPVDFFGPDAHTIVIRIAPTTGGRYALTVNSTHPDMGWTTRALQRAAEWAQLDDGPAVTPDGHLIERHPIPTDRRHP